MARQARQYKFKPPRLNRTNQVSVWQRSIYYWWWEALKRNRAYKRCCEAGGKGRLAALYADFSDVHSVPFERWWNKRVESETRGEYLFAEPLAPTTLHELNSPAEWNEQWTANGVAVIAVPLSYSRQQLERRFSAFLRKRHKGRQGQPNVRQSVARYQVAHQFTILSIRKAFEIHDLRIAEPQLTLFEIGVRCRAVMSAMPVRGEKPEQLRDKKNVMAVAVSRYLAKAKVLIASAATKQLQVKE